jgi:hypothetical protein
MSELRRLLTDSRAASRRPRRRNPGEGIATRPITTAAGRAFVRLGDGSAVGLRFRRCSRTTVSTQAKEGTRMTTINTMVETAAELTRQANDARRKREVLLEIVKLCPKGDVPIGEQLVEQGLAIIDTAGHIHLDAAKVNAALAARRQS